MHKFKTNHQSADTPLLELKNISIRTVEGRMLFDDLNMVLERDRVAIIGRNGIGKSSLLKVIAGRAKPLAGDIRFTSNPYLVPQMLPVNHGQVIKELSPLASEKRVNGELRDTGLAPLADLKRANRLSYGEIRKLRLLAAKLSRPELLLLDEPTEDLDDRGVKWLIGWLTSTSLKTGMLVVSHDRELLNHFHHFFIIKESGCKYFCGSLHEVEQMLEKSAEQAEKKYFQKLESLSRKEEHLTKVVQRRKRKINYGRISELERCTPRQRLNAKRGKAQVSQGKAAKVSQERITALREWTRAGRRALAVKLELELPVPILDTSGNREIVRLEELTAKHGERYLFRDINLSLGYERLAVVGPNGVGKTTLLNIILGHITPFSGRARTFGRRTGYIAQSGENWIVKESLLTLLWSQSAFQTLDEAAELLAAYKFPPPLANRPLASLSPGERARAALICLFQQAPAMELLILDEPTYSLDLVGETALRAALGAWPGTLIITGHRMDFLNAIGVSRLLELKGDGEYSIIK